MVAAVFANGDNLTSCIQVGISNDGRYEGPESFSADIEASTVGMLAIGMPNTSTVEILDPEGTYIINSVFIILGGTYHIKYLI